MTLVWPSSIEIGEIFRRRIGSRWFLGQSNWWLYRWLRFGLHLYFNFWLHLRLSLAEEVGEVKGGLISRWLCGRLLRIRPWGCLSGSLDWRGRDVLFGNLRHNNRRRIDWSSWTISGRLWRLLLWIHFGRIRLLLRLLHFGVCNFGCEGIVLCQSFVFLLSQLLG